MPWSILLIEAPETGSVMSLDSPGLGFAGFASFPRVPPDLLEFSRGQIELLSFSWELLPLGSRGTVSVSPQLPEDSRA